MKRCPQCLRDYQDQSLLYCLDDGAALLDGPGDSESQHEAQTALLNSGEIPRTRPVSSPPTAIHGWLWVGLGLTLMIVVGAGYFVFRPKASAAASPLTAFDILPGEKFTLNLIRYPAVDVSPDGSTIVFSATMDGVSRLYVRRRDDAEVRQLPGTDGASYPVFSPDGKWVAFSSNFEIRKVSLEGLVVSVTKVGDARGVSWLDNEHLIYSPEPAAPLFKISADGGPAEQISQFDSEKSERTHRWPQVLPGGKAVMFTVGTVGSPDSYENANIEAVVISTGERKVLLQKASLARYSPSGHLIFARGGALYAQRFDLDSLTTSGSPESVMQGVAGDVTTGAADYAVASDGMLVYIPGPNTASLRAIYSVDRSGNAQQLNIEPGQYNDVRVSPDGSRLAVTLGSSGSGDIWIYDFGRTTSTRLTFDQKNAAPLWSADGKYVYYSQMDAAAARTNFVRKPADGSRDAETIASIPDGAAYLKAIERGQASAIVDASMLNNRGDIIHVPLGGSDGVAPIVNSEFNDYAAALSPDGRWMAYQSSENGRPQIYVRDLSGAGGRWQVSTDGGEEPRWSPDGRELFYRNNSSFISAVIRTTSTFEAGAPKLLFNGVFDLRNNTGISYDVDPKGARFIMIRPYQNQTAAPAAIRVILNWGDQVTRVVGTK